MPRSRSLKPLCEGGAGKGFLCWIKEEKPEKRKVDDDVVYIAEHAIAELVRERLRQRCLFVSANARASECMLQYIVTLIEGCSAAFATLSRS